MTAIRRSRGAGTTKAPGLYTGHYRPIVDLLMATEDDTLTLTFAQIEAATGRPLSLTAQLSTGYWTQEMYGRVRAWEELGWLARLDRQGKRVEWRRVPPPWLTVPAT